MFHTNDIPKITKNLLLVNIVIHFTVILVFVASTGGWQTFLGLFGLVPTVFWSGALWQPVTSMFLHGGIFHLALNMLALWSIGSPLERSLGSRHFLRMYATAGLAGAFSVAVFQYDLPVPTIGASGAISGLLGALAVLYPNSPLMLFVFPLRARNAALAMGGTSLLLALVDPGSGISHWGHLGGLVGGWVYARFFITSRHNPTQNAFLAGPDLRRFVRREFYVDRNTGRIYCRERTL